MNALRKNAEERILELGGGATPVIQPDGVKNICVDVRSVDNEGRQLPVNFTADFDQPLPIGDADFDCVLTRYTIEHLSWRKVRQFVSEMFRVLKPGGRVWIVTANTEAQFAWIRERGYERQKPEDRKGGEFEDCSCLIFGDQDYPENTHKNYLSPSLAIDLLISVGFAGVQVQPIGALGTDMLVEAIKPSVEADREHAYHNQVKPFTTLDITKPIPPTNEPEPSDFTRIPSATIPNPLLPYLDEEGQKWIKIAQKTPPQEKFSRRYFDGGHPTWGGYAGMGYWDFPIHAITANHVLARKPVSVLELGCGRGYILKRIQDAGVLAMGIEISKHCLMTSVTSPIVEWDLTKIPWPFADKEFDLVFSTGVLDHIPEKHWLVILIEMSRVAKRGLHGIGFDPISAGDKTRCLAKPIEFWKSFDYGHPVEILPKEDIARGDYPKNYLEGDGRLKLNLGSFTTMFHNGWTNLDQHDLKQFAEGYRYFFKQWNAKDGLPYSTGVVDLVYSHHLLEHLTYKEGLSLMRECRRVIRPNGAMRVIVPDADLLTILYQGPRVPHKLEVHPVTSLADFDEVNAQCAESKTLAQKLHSILWEGDHKAIYDAETLGNLLEDAGWDARVVKHREVMKAPWSESPHLGLLQLDREVSTNLSCLSLIVDCIPRLAADAEAER